MKTFRNPVSPYDAPDPFMTYDPVTGYYYALFTRGTRLELFRSRHAACIVTDADSRVIYTPNGERNGIWGDIWAPEMHRGSNGKWYIYTSGRMYSEPSEKRIFVMEGPSADPFEGEWIFRGKPFPDTFSIDPTVYTAPDGVQYLCSSRVDRVYGQVLDICDLENPYTCGKNVATIARAELDWELVKPYVGGSAIVEARFSLSAAVGCLSSIRQTAVGRTITALVYWSIWAALFAMPRIGRSMTSRFSFMETVFTARGTRPFSRLPTAPKSGVLIMA